MAYNTVDCRLQFMGTELSEWTDNDNDNNMRLHIRLARVVAMEDACAVVTPRSGATMTMLIRVVDDRGQWQIS